MGKSLTLASLLFLPALSALAGCLIGPDVLHPMNLSGIPKIDEKWPSEWIEHPPDSNAEA